MVESNKVVSCCKCFLEYVSVACNRTPLCVDWGRNGWVAYGACYSIALYRPKVGFTVVHIDPNLRLFFPRADEKICSYFKSSYHWLN